jgi:predicted dehydrogenase
MNTRRDFLRTSGAAAAAFAFGQTPTSTRKIGYCIVGLGRISLNQFMPGIAGTQNSKLVALVSGHRDKAEAAAAKYGIGTANIYDYEHYDEIAHNPEIDAVYIALPNGMHPEYTIRAAKAGKHVLCEKPMANTARDCEQMIAACRTAQRRLMVAYRCRYQGTHLRAVQIAHDGSIGELKFIEATFGFSIAKGEWRLTKKLAGGGPLMDVGIYCLNACRYLTGEEPRSLSASSSVITQDGRFTEVEENVFWNMRFPSGVVATCATSYGSNCGNYFKAVGTKGWVQLDPAYSYEGLRFKAHLAMGLDIDTPVDDPSPKQFTREADHFSQCLLDNKDPKTPGEEGLRDMRLIEAIYKSAAADHPMAV